MIPAVGSSEEFGYVVDMGGLRVSGPLGTIDDQGHLSSVLSLPDMQYCSFQQINCVIKKKKNAISRGGFSSEPKGPWVFAR